MNLASKELDELCRKLVTQNLVEIVETMDVDPMIPFLRSVNVLGTFAYERVSAKPTRYERCQELMDTINMRGRGGFIEFIRALLHTDQISLAMRIVNGGYNLLEKFAEVADSEVPIQQLMVDLQKKQKLSLTANGAGDERRDDALIEEEDETVKWEGNLAPPTPEVQEMLQKSYEGAEAIAPVEETKGILAPMKIEQVDAATISRSFVGPSAELSLDHVYKNFSSPKGLVLIINNRDFRPGGMPTRSGTDVDCENIRRTFIDLGYAEPKVKENLTGREMVRQMKRLAAKASLHKKMDSCAVVILSHGENGTVYGSDEEQVEIDRLVSCLSSQECPELAKKPKLFFIQACRGKTYDAGHILMSSDLVDGAKMAVQEGNREQLDVVRSKAASLDEADTAGIRGSVEKIPDNAEMLVAYATTPGYVSWRNSVRGSWFIQAICEVFHEHGHNEPLTSLMLRVNRRVSQAMSSTGEPKTDGCKQISDASFRMTKEFYFFPGVTREQFDSIVASKQNGQQTNGHSNGYHAHKTTTTAGLNVVTDATNDSALNNNLSPEINTGCCGFKFHAAKKRPAEAMQQ